MSSSPARPWGGLALKVASSVTLATAYHRSMGSYRPGLMSVVDVGDSALITLDLEYQPLG